MIRFAVTNCMPALLLAWGVTMGAGADDWLQWRGPSADNHAAENVEAPFQWNLVTGKGVVWNQAIPGRGHSSPIVVGDAIYLTTADEQAGTQSLLVLERLTGEVRRTILIHDGGLPETIHRKNSHASPTVASDGKHQYVVFYNDDAIRATAIDDDGRVLWRRKVCDFNPAAFQYGYGASPIIEGDLLIVAAEYDGPDSGLYALDKRHGRTVWEVSRPSNLSFSSPIATHIAGRRQLLIPGAEKMQSFDPQSGKLLWTAEASTDATCGTVVWDNRTVLISGGDPVSGTWAVLADGSEKLLWSNSIKCYEPSLLATDGYVYAVADNGAAYCWKVTDGAEMWTKPLDANFSASPLLIDKRIYVASESGEAFVFRATPARFELIAENRLGDEVFASPVAVGDRLFVRYASYASGQRQEYVAALGR